MNNDITFLYFSLVQAFYLKFKIFNGLHHFLFKELQKSGRLKTVVRKDTEVEVTKNLVVNRIELKSRTHKGNPK